MSEVVPTSSLTVIVLLTDAKPTLFLAMSSLSMVMLWDAEVMLHPPVDAVPEKASVSVLSVAMSGVSLAVTVSVALPLCVGSVQVLSSIDPPEIVRS